MDHEENTSAWSTVAHVKQTVHSGSDESLAHVAQFSKTSKGLPRVEKCLYTCMLLLCFFAGLGLVSFSDPI